MSKGERTRDMIVARAAPLFNTRGYAGVSVSAVMEATGLEKGGIYRHFDGKDALALAAFDFNVAVLTKRFAEAARSHRHAVDRLLGIVNVYKNVVDAPPVAGGCPILNTAVEADDTDPALSERARAALADLQRFMVTIIEKGITRGEIRPSIDPLEVVTILLAALEGAIMMSRLQRDNVYMDRVLGYLTMYLNTAVRV